MTDLNTLLRTLNHCSIDVKLELFRSFCTSFYCCYLWTAYKKSTFNKIRVAFNNAYRRVLGLPWRSSTSAMYANFGIQNFEAVIRKSTLDLHNDWPKALIFLLWLLKVHGVYVLIYMGLLAKDTVHYCSNKNFYYIFFN